MLLPAVIYLALQRGQLGQHGWGTVISTDTVFVVGCAVLLGRRAPPGLRLFLLSLAIVNGIGAVFVVAIGYCGEISWTVQAVAGGVGSGVSHMTGDIAPARTDGPTKPRVPALVCPEACVGAPPPDNRPGRRRIHYNLMRMTDFLTHATAADGQSSTAEPGALRRPRPRRAGPTSSSPLWSVSSLLCLAGSRVFQSRPGFWASAE